MSSKHCTRCGYACPEEALYCSQCGNALHRADQDPLIGRTIAGRYYLVERIGQGGAGTLYRAEHVTLRRRMAVKLLHQQLSVSEEAVERFRREAITVCEIDNDHILQVHDFGRADDGRLFFAMEFLEGEALSAVLLREGKLSIERTGDILGQLADALMEAHALGYVHRDLRPRNVFLTRRRGRADFVKLLDFGLAKLVLPDIEADKTTMGMTFGDPHYMAPEQARGEVVDRRADIYSLGAIAFEMLTGRPPYRGAGTFDILSKVMDAEVPRVLDLRPDCPEWLESVVRVALAKAPSDRFPTVSQLLEALQRKQVLERQPPLPKLLAPPKERLTVLEQPPVVAPAHNSPAVAKSGAAPKATRAYGLVSPVSTGTDETSDPIRKLSRRERRQLEQERREKERLTRAESRDVPVAKTVDVADRKAREIAARELAERAAREAAEAEARLRAEEEKRREEEARRKAEEEERRKAEEEARKKEAEAKRKAEEEARGKREEEKRKAEEEARRKAREEERRKAEEARRAEEEARRKAKEEAARRAEEARAEEARRKAEADIERRAKEAAERAKSLAARTTQPKGGRAPIDQETIAREAAAWEEAAQELLHAQAAEAAMPGEATAQTPAPAAQLSLPVEEDEEEETRAAELPTPAPKPAAQDEAAADTDRGSQVRREDETVPMRQVTGEHEAVWFDAGATAHEDASSKEEYEEEPAFRRRLPILAAVAVAAVMVVAIGTVAMISLRSRPQQGEAAIIPPGTEKAPTVTASPSIPQPEATPAASAPTAPIVQHEIQKPPPEPVELEQPPPPVPAIETSKKTEPAAKAPPAKLPVAPVQSAPAAAKATKEPPAASPKAESKVAKTPTTAAPVKAPLPVVAPKTEPAFARLAKEAPPAGARTPPAVATAKPMDKGKGEPPAKAAATPAPKKPPLEEAKEAAPDKKPAGESVSELLRSGREQLQSGDLNAAMSSFTRARDLDQKNPEALAGLGEAAFEQGSWDDSVKYLQKAIRLSPRRASYQVLLGQSLYKLGQYKDAAEACKRALRLDPSLRDAQRTLEQAEKKLSESSRAE